MWYVTLLFYWRFNEHDVSPMCIVERAKRAKYLNTVLYLAPTPLAISTASCEGKQTPKNNHELPHYRVNPHLPIFRFFLFFAPFALREDEIEVTHLLE